jgi:hypothetical protein
MGRLGTSEDVANVVVSSSERSDSSIVANAASGVAILRSSAGPETPAGLYTFAVVATPLGGFAGGPIGPESLLALGVDKLLAE